MKSKKNGTRAAKPKKPSSKKTAATVSSPLVSDDEPDVDLSAEEKPAPAKRNAAPARQSSRAKKISYAEVDDE